MAFRQLQSLEEERVRVDALEQVFEDELVCSICSELYVRTMSLACSHSFCYTCIVRWMTRKMECPICRVNIRSCVPCLVLDNTISGFVQHLRGDGAQNRTELVLSRKSKH